MDNVYEEDMPGLHIYTKGTQLGRKQIFGDHGIVLVSCFLPSANSKGFYNYM